MAAHRPDPASPNLDFPILDVTLGDSDFWPLCQLLTERTDLGSVLNLNVSIWYKGIKFYCSSLSFIYKYTTFYEQMEFDFVKGLIMHEMNLYSLTTRSVKTNRLGILRGTNKVKVEIKVSCKVV